MPKPSAETRQYHLRLLGGTLLLLLMYLAYTEATPTGVVCGQMGVHCQETVALYANAVKRYKIANRRLPLSLDQLVPEYLPEHHDCDGVYSGCHPNTRFHIVETIKSLLEKPAPPKRPDYNIIQLSDGTVTFQIQCNRAHSERVGLRGDTGQFFVYDEMESTHFSCSVAKSAPATDTQLAAH